MSVRHSQVALKFKKRKECKASDRVRNDTYTSHTHRVFGACVWEKNDEWLVLLGTQKNHVQTLKSTQNATIESLKLIYIFNERERARAHTLTQTRNNIIDRSTGRQPRVYMHEWNVITNVLRRIQAITLNMNTATLTQQLCWHYQHWLHVVFMKTILPPLLALLLPFCRDFKDSENIELYDLCKW